MNNSIYFMVSVPYVTLGILTLLIYRGLKKNRAYFAALDQNDETSAANAG